MKAIIGHKFTSFKAVAVLLCLTLATSCVNLMHLDRAQNQFNQGATIENQLRFNPQSDAPTSPSLYYNAAYSAVKKALENKADLEKDDVIANAYIIKALCEWKLKYFDEAEKTVKLAVSELDKLETKKIKLPRDKALMQALPILITIDKGKQEIFAAMTATDISFETACRYYQDNVFNSDNAKNAKLENTIKELGKIQSNLMSMTSLDPDFSLYLIMAQLAALKTCSDGLEFIRRIALKDPTIRSGADTKSLTFSNEQRIGIGGIDKLKKDLIDELKKHIGGEEGKALAAYWGDLI